MSYCLPAVAGIPVLVAVPPDHADPAFAGVYTVADVLAGDSIPACCSLVSRLLLAFLLTVAPLLLLVFQGNTSIHVVGVPVVASIIYLLLASSLLSLASLTLLVFIRVSLLWLMSRLALPRPCCCWRPLRVACIATVVYIPDLAGDLVVCLHSFILMRNCACKLFRYLII